MSALAVVLEEGLSAAGSTREEGGGGHGGGQNGAGGADPDKGHRPAAGEGDRAYDHGAWDQGNEEDHEGAQGLASRHPGRSKREEARQGGGGEDAYPAPPGPIVQSFLQFRAPTTRPITRTSWRCAMR